MNRQFPIIRSKHRLPTEYSSNPMYAILCNTWTQCEQARMLCIKKKINSQNCIFLQFNNFPKIIRHILNKININSCHYLNPPTSFHGMDIQNLCEIIIQWRITAAHSISPTPINEIKFTKSVRSTTATAKSYLYK